MKYLAATCGVVLATVASSPAFAVDSLIDGTLAGSDVALQFKPGTSTDPGGTTGLFTDSGAVIAGSVGSSSFGSGASYASTADVGPGVIYFKNGNASSGQFSYSKSTTLVDVTFTNTGTKTVTPFLRSQIVPAGFGIFVGPNGCSDDPESCNPADITPGNFNSFRPVTDGGVPSIGGVPADVLSSASFSFRIFANNFVAYELQGSLTLRYDAAGGGDSFVIEDTLRASQELNGYRRESPDGSRDFIGYLWDTTDIDVPFPDALLPGEFATLRYETIVETYSRSSCIGLGSSSCLVSYASFGDPVGRSGGSGGAGRIAPDAMQAFSRLGPLSTLNDPPTGILFDEFTFRAPVFNPETGDVSLVLEGNAYVPEPESWALMIAGFGLIGATLRQRRRVAA